MKIDRLILKNFRCFEALEIDFHPRLTVLTARNGGGKTAVADALTIALGPFVGAFPDGRGRHISKWDMRCVSLVKKAIKRINGSAIGTTWVETNSRPVTVESFGSWNESDQHWIQELRSSKGRTTTGGASALSQYGKDLKEALNAQDLSEQTILPIVAYYGTGRLWGARRLAKTRIKIKQTRTSGYAGCLDFVSNYRSFAEWFSDMLYRQYQAEKSEGEYAHNIFKDAVECVRSALDHCLQPTGWRCLNDSPYFNELTFLRGNIENTNPSDLTLTRQIEEIPVSMQSDGIRAVTGLVGDIARRTHVLNPRLAADAAALTPGVVVIDEVDMHLHPEWQQLILPGLQSAFPCIQFIVTTHSPQVLTTVKRESIRIISYDAEGMGSAVIPMDQSYAAESQQVLAEIMEVFPRPKNLPESRDINRYMEIAQNGKFDGDEAAALRVKIETLGIAEQELKIADLLIARRRVFEKG